MKREVIVVNDFYADPDAIVTYAKNLRYYNPYADNWIGSNRPEVMEQAGWHASHFIKAKDCPFKSSAVFIRALEQITSEEIDREIWDKDYPEDPETGARADPWPYLKDPSRPFTYENSNQAAVSARWNCAFHFKYHPGKPGEGVHNHAQDTWNDAGPDGWAGLIYLNKNAPRGAGLKLMRNKYGNDLEKFTDADRWELLDDFANVYNRLLLVRGSYPHVGGPGFGTTHESARLFQTLFFRIKKARVFDSVRVSVP